jgi:hypothetical protein
VHLCGSGVEIVLSDVTKFDEFVRSKKWLFFKRFLNGFEASKACAITPLDFFGLCIFLSGRWSELQN